MSDDPLFGDVSSAPPRPTRPNPTPKPDPKPAPAPEPARKARAPAKPKRDADEEPGIHTPAILPRALRRRLDREVSLRNLDRADSGEGDRATVSGLIRELIEAELPKLEKKRAG